MEKQETGFDDELTAIQTVLETLKPLEPDSRQRVIEYVTARLEISTVREGLPDLAPERLRTTKTLPQVRRRPRHRSVSKRSQNCLMLRSPMTTGKKR